MSLPKNITQLEYTKFVETSVGKPGVIVVNPDGTNIASATVYAVVNTGAVGNTNSLATLLSGPNQIGSVTVSNPIQIATGTNSIGLATVFAGSPFAITDNSGSITVDWLSGATVTVGNTINSLLQAGTSYVGLASVNIGGTLPALALGTNFIGLATVVHANNVTLNASSAFIGLSTVVHGSNVTLNASNAYIGLASVNIGGTLPALSAGAAFIGLATVNIGSSNTVILGVGTSKIGLVTLSASNAFIGLATVVHGNNVTLNASNAFIGLATTVNAASNAYIGLVTIIPTYLSTYTSLATIISASGNATLFTPPNGQRWILKDLMIGSLGRQEVKIISGAADFIPYIALATTGGYLSNFGDSGMRAKAVNDAFVVALSGAATISITVNVRFE